MAEDGVESVWRARLRWRQRGAWLWPAFVVMTIVDALLLRALPVAGDHTDVAGAVLLAMFFNLVAVAVAAPLASRALRRRRPDLPKVIADDRAGTTFVALVFVGLLAVGLAHRPARMADRRAFHAQSEAVRQYVAHNAALEYREHIDQAGTVTQTKDLYRTCVPGNDPARPLCLLINTDQSPPGVVVDHDHTPNVYP